MYAFDQVCEHVSVVVENSVTFCGSTPRGRSTPYLEVKARESGEIPEKVEDIKLCLEHFSY